MEYLNCLPKVDPFNSASTREKGKQIMNLYILGTRKSHAVSGATAFLC
jgi:hypothetical protein